MENSPVKPLPLSQVNNVQDTTQLKEQLGQESFNESVQIPEDNAPRSILALQTLQDEKFEVRLKYRWQKSALFDECTLAHSESPGSPLEP